MDRKEDHYHPILERAWEYEVFTFSFYQWADEESEPFIDVTLKRGDELRHLRFYSPQDLEIEKGFPRKTGGFCIFDVSARGMEGLNVRVDDVEGSWGAVRFWAREVIEIGRFERAL
ncbi:MAG TPA: hypothetical protein VF658_06580 [Pyrinomonadaceae bacterium]